MSSSINTVLITGVGGPAGRSVCNQLRALDPTITIIGTDIRPVTAETDVFGIGYRARDREHVPFLQSLITQYQVDLLIPTVQDELPIIAAHAAELSAPVIISDARVTEICHDKLLTALYLGTLGISAPWTRAATEVPHSYHYPLVLKPRVSRGGRGVRILDSPDQAFDLDSSLIIQAFAPGTEYCPQIYRSPLSGDVFVAVLEKTELKQGRVGNAASVQRLPEDAAPDIAQLAQDTTTALDLYGPLDMDIRREASGIPVVLEVNARFGANSAHAPELLTSLLADAARLQSPAQPEKAWRR